MLCPSYCASNDKRIHVLCFAGPFCASKTGKTICIPFLDLAVKQNESDVKIILLRGMDTLSRGDYSSKLFCFTSVKRSTLSFEGRSLFIRDLKCRKSNMKSQDSLVIMAENNFPIYPLALKFRTITKTRLFKYIENFTSRKLKIFR